MSGHEIIGLAGVVCGTFALLFISYLIHASDRQEYVKFGFPRILPWSAQSKLRKAKIDVELEHTASELYEAKHRKMQQELVFMELEQTRHDRALGKGHTES